MHGCAVCQTAAATGQSCSYASVLCIFQQLSAGEDSFYAFSLYSSSRAIGRDTMVPQRFALIKRCEQWIQLSRRPIQALAEARNLANFLRVAH